MNIEDLNLPVWYPIIDNLEDEGFTREDFTISIVDNPAIERSYLKFDKSKKLKFSKLIQGEKRQLFGPIMLADFPIYQRDEKYGEHYIIFSPLQIENYMKLIFKNKLHLYSNLNHLKQDKIDNAYLFEAFQVNRELGINPPKGYEDVNDGSFFGRFQIEDEKTWDIVNSDEFTGFSIEGKFTMSKERDNIDIDDIFDLIEDLKNDYDNWIKNRKESKLNSLLFNKGKNFNDALENWTEKDWKKISK
jgi:hypothetical protein